MTEHRYTATEIAQLIADPLELPTGERDRVHHRVRYLAKKGYLKGGRKIDRRGTQDFPPYEVYRAAVLCEFLSLSIDVGLARRWLEDVQILGANSVRHGNMPDPSRSLGEGWDRVVHGALAGEEWLLVVEPRRSENFYNAGSVARCILANDQQTSVEQALGRSEASTSLIVNLRSLFTPILRGS